jgi:predicted nuclease of predicted toxin-antitoxin system
MEWARQHDYLVFTHDLDYGALLYATGAKAPSVIQARGDDVRPSALAVVVLKALEEAGPDLRTGALVTVDIRRHRITVLPLRR